MYQKFGFFFFHSISHDLIRVMIEDLDVSTFGSKMGIIHGTTGDWISNVTDSPASLHFAIANKNYTCETRQELILEKKRKKKKTSRNDRFSCNFDFSPAGPSGINFLKVLDRASTFFDLGWQEKHEKRIVGNLGQAVVFLAPRVRFNTVDQQAILTLIQKFKKQHPGK